MGTGDFERASLAHGPLKVFTDEIGFVLGCGNAETFRSCPCCLAVSLSRMPAARGSDDFYVAQLNSLSLSSDHPHARRA